MAAIVPGLDSKLIYLAATIALILSTIAAAKNHLSYQHDGQDVLATTAATETLSPHVSLKTREHWMRVAISALPSPCPFAAFGAAIVNHTASAKGELVCIGANSAHETGNPTHHGEIAAINNCTSVLTDPRGAYRLSPQEAYAAWQDLSLYTTGEPCPMCASAIRWGGFREMIYATSIETLIQYGWTQLTIPSREVFERGVGFRNDTVIVEGILEEETDPLFAWQFQRDAACPKGCRRPEDEAGCVLV